MSGSTSLRVREEEARQAPLIALAARLLGTSCVFVTPGEAEGHSDGARASDGVRAEVAQARACAYDESGLAPDGRVVAVRLASGEVLGAVAEGEGRFTRDDLEALRALASVQTPSVEARVLDAVGEALLVTDAAGRCVIVNREAERLLGTARHTLRHADDCTLFPESPLQTALDRARHSGRPVAFDGYSARLDRHLAVRAYPFEQGLAVYFRDLTQERADAQALESARLDAERSLSQLGALFDHLREGVVLVDPATGVGRFNPAASALAGLQQAEETQPLAALARRFDVATLDGVPLAAAARPYARLLRAESFDGLDLRVKRLPDGPAYVLRYRGMPIAGSDGTPWLLLLSFQDVTAWYDATATLDAQRRTLEDLNAELEARVSARTAELAQSSAALERRVGELRDFTFIASHDLQEPLRKIQAFAELVDETTDLSDEARGYLERVRTSAAHMRRLLSDLLHYTRIAAFDRDVVPVALDDTFVRLEADFRDRLARQEALLRVGPLSAVLGDEILARRLFEQLLANALYFRRGEVRPEIDVREVPAPPGFVAVAVQDNGIGFDEKYLDRIFKPFQRLHARGTYAGTGMGLAIATRIAERLGGTLTARSTPDEGSTFTVVLPRAETA